MLPDDVQELDGQRQEPGGQHQDRGHVQAVQEPHDRQTGRQERPERSDGHIEGGGEELVAQAVRSVRCSPRHNQAVLPRRREWPEEGLPGQELRAAESALCLIALHGDDRRAYQDFRQIPDQ